jgi:iron complex outermembrane recepter protein
MRDVVSYVIGAAPVRLHVFPIAACCLALLGVPSKAAYAQATAPAATANSDQAQAPAAEPTQSGDQLQEVVVTAEKRESDLQKTPVAVAAVSQAALTENGVTEFTSIQKVAPDVNITNSAAGPVINIRGVYSTQSNNPGADNATATFFNGVYLKDEVMQGLMFDMQRVEVDKGPQTTLYGKNAEAGAINFISNKPVLEQASGEGQLEYGSYNTLRTEGMLNVPIGDTFALRFAAQSYRHNGYMDSGLDDADTQSARLSTLWQPNGNETLTLVGDYSVDDANDDQAVVRNVIGLRPCNGSSACEAAEANIYVPSNPRDDTFANGDDTGASHPFYRHSVNYGVMAQNDYDFGFATWTTQLAFRHFDLAWNAPSPQTIGPTTPLQLAPNGVAYPQPLGSSWSPQLDQMESLETRLTSDSTRPLQWVAGLFLYHDVNSGTMQQFSTPLPVQGVGTDPTAPGYVQSTQTLQFGSPYYGAKTAAVFAQTTYTPDALPALHLTGGGRLESDYKNQAGEFTEFGPTNPTPFEPVHVPYSSYTWRSGTYRAEIGYDLTPESMIYADTATAFKAGGFGYGPGTDPAVGPIVEPERITSYEIGSKNRFLDDTLQVNLEGWLYTYKNFENVEVYYSGPVYGLGPPAIGTANSGGAHYHGVTLDLDYLFTPQDVFATSVSWLYGRYGSYVQQLPAGYSFLPCPLANINSFTPCAGQRTNTYLSNTYIPDIPSWTGTASYMHTWPNVLGGSISGRVAAQFQSSELQEMVQDPVYGTFPLRTGGWVMGDVSLAYQPRHESWKVEAYVHNVTNRVVPTSETYNTTYYYYSASFYPPRIIGLIISAKF